MNLEPGQDLFKTLLIDADVLAFVAASAVQIAVEEDGMIRQMGNIREGEVVVDNLISSAAAMLHSRGAARVFYLSCKTEDGWRKNLWPQYKEARGEKASERPLLLDKLKDYLREEYGATSVNKLEADDMIGIVMTEYEHGTHCSVGRDKDFLTIPGCHHTIQTDFFHNQSLQEANAFFYAQVLAGDRVDGFFGAEGIGMKRAVDIIAAGKRVIPQRGVITRGPNKGKETTKWVTEDAETIWDVIVTHYEKSGQTEGEALRNARLANILRHDQYNMETGEIIFWSPTLWRRA